MAGEFLRLILPILVVIHGYVGLGPHLLLFAHAFLVLKLVVLAVEREPGLVGRKSNLLFIGRCRIVGVRYRVEVAAEAALALDLHVQFVLLLDGGGLLDGLKVGLHSLAVLLLIVHVVHAVGHVTLFLFEIYVFAAHRRITPAREHFLRGQRAPPLVELLLALNMRRYSHRIVVVLELIVVLKHHFLLVLACDAV